MNFPLVPEYQFDIDGTNPENEIDNETIDFPKSEHITVIVPRHAPFFVDGLVLKDKNNDLLVKGKDYRIYRIMGRLSAYCAQEVSSFIEILNPELELVYATYKTVGDVSLFDKGLAYEVMSAINDPRTIIDYEYIKNRPTAFKPEDHKHSLLYGVVAFQDTVDTIATYIDYLQKQGSHPIRMKLDAVVNIVRSYIKLYTDQLTELLETHKNAYNSHGLNKGKIGLSETQNHGTGTQKDIDEAYREDLLVTPKLLDYAINEAKINTSAYLNTNTIPMSTYGTGDYIPPSIDGSFEGIGSATECTGFCLEADGNLMLLKNQFDGRTSGLYYSRIEDFRSSKPKYIFTGYKYQHSRILADGCNVTRIVQGSNENVLMVGDLQKDAWYIALTNGTFDASKHVMSKIDMTDLLAILNENTGETRFKDEYYMAVHYFGKYTYILLSMYADTDSDFGESSRIYFTRALSSDIAKGGTVKFSRFKVRYQNIHGQLYTQQDYMRMMIRRKNGDGKVTSCYYTYSPYATNNVVASWKPISMSSQENSQKLLRFQLYIQAAYVEAGVSKICHQRPTIIYSFEPDAGYLTMLSRTSDQMIDFINMSQDEINAITEADNLGGEWVRPNGGFNFTSYILPTGELIVTQTSGSGSYPANFGIHKYQNRNTKYDLTKSVFSKLDQNKTQGVPGAPTKTYANGIIQSPIANGDTPTVMGYDNANELMNGHQPPGYSGRSCYFYRKVSGDYDTREGIFNVNFALKSRPLTNTVYNTDVAQSTPFINYSGDSAAMAASSSTMGQLRFAVGASVNGVPYPTDVFKELPWDTKHENVFMTFPRASKFVQKTGTDGKPLMSLTVDSWYGVTQDAMNKMEGLLAKENPDELRTATVFVIDDAGGVFKRASFAVVCVTCDRLNQSYALAQLFVVAINWEEPNTAHPTTRVIKDVTLLQSSSQYNITASEHRPIAELASGSRIGSLQIYRSGDTLQCGLFNPILLKVIGDSVTPSFVFDIETVGMTLNVKEYYRGSWYVAGNGYTYQTIPRHGLGKNLSGTESGFAALTTRIGDDRFLVASIYPESGWIVYFQTINKVSFNGAEYVMGPGSIDLRDLGVTYVNTTFYIYVRLTSGTPEYHISTSKIPNSTFSMWIGTVKTNEKQILSIERRNVFLINGYIVSEQKRGSAIPSSSGLISSDGQFPWVKETELLN